MAHRVMLEVLANPLRLALNTAQVPAVALTGGDFACGCDL